MKLRTRIIVGLLIILASAFYYMVNWLIDDLRPHYLKSMEESLVDTSVLLSSLVANTISDDGLDIKSLKEAFRIAYTRKFKALIYDKVKTNMNINIYITDTTGVVVFDSDEGKWEGQNFSKWNDVHLTLQGEYGARATRTNPEDPATSVLYVAAPIIVDGAITGVLTVYKPSGSVNVFIESAKSKLIIGGVVSAVVISILTILLSIWVSWPISKLTEYAKAVRDGKKETFPKLGTFSQYGSGGIGVMGKALEEMQEALEGKKYIEEYVQTLTHELKSPVAAIKGAGELLGEEMPAHRREKFVKNIQTESVRIEELIEKLLALASLENRKSLKEQNPISLFNLLEDIKGSFQPVLEKRKIECTVELSGKCVFNGESFLVRQALANIIQNSIEFIGSNGEISIFAEEEAGKVVVSMYDTGTGIPEYALEKIFNRFYSLQRPESGKKSSGLGLSFVKEVMELHEGTISINNYENENQSGVVVRLSFLISSKSASK